MYENSLVTVAAFLDVPVYADQEEVRANRVDARIVDRERKRITLLEMGCPWVENHSRRKKKRPSNMPHYA